MLEIEAPNPAVVRLGLPDHFEEDMRKKRWQNPPVPWGAPKERGGQRLRIVVAGT